jgi:hypothetical protein
MKKDLSKPAIAGIVAVIAVLFVGLAWRFAGAGSDSGPSPDLLEKQIAYQKSLVPGATRKGVDPQQAALQSEMEARRRTQGNH